MRSNPVQHSPLRNTFPMRARNAFACIELSFVISLIGGLATILLPLPVKAGQSVIAPTDAQIDDLAGNETPNIAKLASGRIVLYVRNSTASGMDKYLYVPGSKTWIAEGSVALAGIEHITTAVSGDSVSLYASTAAAIYFFSDTSNGGSIAGATFSKIAAPDAGVALREPSLVPEPGIASLLMIGAAGMLRSRRPLSIRSSNARNPAALPSTARPATTARASLRRTFA
jgi:hypothetical protein